MPQNPLVPSTAPPFSPGAPLSRRSIVQVKPKTKGDSVRPIAEPILTPIAPPPLIPKEKRDAFLDLESPHWPTSLAFLRLFKASLFCYIADGERHGVLPVIHTHGVDGLTPQTRCMPIPQRQDQGYGIYFSVNGFAGPESRKEASLYSLNALFADIDWPNKDNPPSPKQLADFKRAVYEDLCFCIGNAPSEEEAKDYKTLEHVPPPTAIVETRNGYHVYWVFDEPLLGNDAEPLADLLPKYKAMQRAIVSRFQADPQCVDAARVLRVPSSFHLKQEEAFLISLSYFDPTIKYSWKQMEDFWIQNPKATNPSYAYHHAEEFRKHVKDTRAHLSARTSLLSHGANALASPAHVGFLPTYDGFSEEDQAALDALYPIEERDSFKSLTRTRGIKEGSRNKSLLIASSLLRRAGKTKEEVEERFAQGYNGLPLYEIRATIASAYVPNTPYDFGWNDPVFAEHVSLEEATKVRSLVKQLKGAKGAEAKALQSPRQETPEASKEETPEETPEEEAFEAKLTIAALAKIEEDSKVKILDRNTQKRIYQMFESIFAKTRPNIVSVDDVGFYEYVAEKRLYVRIPDEGIRRMILEDLTNLGCLDYKGVSSISAKVEALSAHGPIRLSRADAESVFFGGEDSGIQGTIVNTLSGFVDLNTGAIRDDLGKLFVTSVVPVNYEDHKQDLSEEQSFTDGEYLSAIAPRFCRFLHEITAARSTEEGHNKRRILQEIAGYCLTPHVHLQMAFILIGNGANGKSTFLDLLRKLVGPEDTSTLSFPQLSSQFMLAGLYRKKLNIIEEIPQNYFESENLKKIISGQEISAERKYIAEPLRFCPTVKLVFAVNAFPKVNDQSNALYRRFLILPFNATFSGKKRDADLPEYLWRERDAIFRWAMAGWQRLKQNKAFTLSEEVREAGQRFQENNSPLVEFLLSDCFIQPKENTDEAKDWSVPVRTLYDLYREYASRNGYGVKSKSTFIREISTLTHAELGRVKLPVNSLLVVGLKIKPREEFLFTDRMHS